MKRLLAPVLCLAVLTTLFQRPALATTLESPDGAVQWLTIASVGVSALNIGFLVFPPHGSKAAGIIGGAVGTALIVATSSDDTLEQGEGSTYYAFGITCAAIGLLDYFVAGNGRDTAILGMRVDPSLRWFDGQGWLGLKLESSW